MNVFKCLAFALILFTTSCLSEKKAAGIKSAAIQDYVKHTPCVSDTLIFSGGSDTAIVLDTIYVEENIPQTNDTKIENEFLTIPQHLSFDSPKVSHVIKLINKTLYIHDTITKNLRDLRFEQMYKDSLLSSQKANYELKQQVTEESSKASIRKLIIWAENILLFILLLVGVYLYFKSGFLKGIIPH